MTRDLDRLAARVLAHRLEQYPSRLAAARAAGISKDTWHRVERGEEVIGPSYAAIDRALGWATGSCVAVAEGGEPLLVEAAGDLPPPAEASPPLGARQLREAAFEAAMAKLPSAPIGEVRAFADELVQVLRRGGSLVDDE